MIILIMKRISTESPYQTELTCIADFPTGALTESTVASEERVIVLSADVDGATRYYCAVSILHNDIVKFLMFIYCICNTGIRIIRYNLYVINCKL